MKVVLFCGGQGLRMREFSNRIPKPLAPIGERPVLWHVMKYYASYGHRDFVLCLGYQGDVIKNYFRSYDETISNDFVLSDGGRQIELLTSDIADWRITFADTGLDTTIGERLRRVRHLLAGEEIFLANYGDTLTDAHLPTMVDRVRASDVSASFLAVKPNYSFHVVNVNDDGRVGNISDVTKSEMWINGGYFVMRSSFLDDLRLGEDLVEEPLQRAIAAGQVLAHRHDGFWAPMDTLKEKQWLESLHESGTAPWELWNTQPESDSGIRGLVSA